MSKIRTVLATLGLVTVVSALTMSTTSLGPASAATDVFGNGCTETAPNPETTLIVTGTADDAVPAAAPFGGVVTSVRVNSAPLSAAYPTTFKVMRRATAADQFTTIAQSQVVNISGAQSFVVRMPVRAGDLLGANGSAGTLLCTTSKPDDTFAFTQDDPAPGSTNTYVPGHGVGLPFVATVEPDADGDGFGDITQDLCPHLATVQTACPVPVVKAAAAAQSKRTVDVDVTSSARAQVTVSGATAIHGRTFTLRGSSRTVGAGETVTFRVRLPNALRVALRTLSAGRRITVKVTASAVDELGNVVTTTTSARLHGNHHR